MRIDSDSDRSMISRLRRSGGRRPWLRLLCEVLQLAGTDAELLSHTERPWASVTFSGSRHTISLAFSGDAAPEAADDFIAALPEHEFTIPRQIVADAAITAVDQVALPEPKVTVEAELLLLEDV